MGAQVVGRGSWVVGRGLCLFEDKKKINIGVRVCQEWMY